MKFKLSALMMFAALLAGCGGMPETVIQTPLTARPQAASAVTPPMNGAIFQTASYRPMFEDRRARLIGDTITITINERSSAGKQAGSSGSKTGSVVAAAPIFLAYSEMPRTDSVQVLQVLPSMKTRVSLLRVIISSVR